MNEVEIREVVAHAVREIMLTLGIDVSTPEAIKDVQADAQWTRKSRLGAEQVTKLIKRGFIGVLIPGLIYVIWLGVRTMVPK